jgi:hypothetical protein
MNCNFIKLWVQAVQKPGAIFLLASLVALSGCGGGSASTTSTENQLPSPVAGGIDGEELVPGTVGQSPIPASALELLPQVSVGQRQFADPNVLLNLRGTVAAAANSDLVKTLWTQVTGPQVIIPSPLALENVILMPDVNVATQLEFRLTAEDSEGRVNSATVSILIKPVPTFVKVVGGVFNEADESAVFTVHLNAPSTLPLTISYVTQDGTATSEGDYEFASGEIILAAGEVVAEIPIVLINDVAEENDESFSLQVTAIDGEVSRANTGVAIIRNDTEPQLSQAITFTDAGPVSIYPGQEYTNILSTQAPGTGDIIYSSSNSSVASVDAQGKIVGLTTGNAQITATKLADDVYLSATNSYSVQVAFRGQAIQFTSQGPVDIFFNSVYSNPLDPAFASPGTGSVVYASSNPLVATVDNQGNITPVSLGTTTISAVKSADNVYSSAQASYSLRVIGRGAAPVVSFSQSSAIYQDGTSVLMGRTMNFSGSAQDAEDGALPTAAQVSNSQATGLPITSLRWTSSVDGFLGNGSSLNGISLTMGMHRITYSVTDSDGNVGSASIRVLVGNVAPLADASASSTYCTTGDCYSPLRTNDSSLITTVGNMYSWVNDNPNVALPQWVMLSWHSPVTISTVDIYTSVGYLIRDYDIEYLNGTAWTLLVSVKDNAVEFRTHPIPTITTSSLRVMARKGSVLQSQHARINEIVVFGTGGARVVIR